MCGRWMHGTHGHRQHQAPAAGPGGAWFIPHAPRGDPCLAWGSPRPQAPSGEAEGRLRRAPGGCRRRIEASRGAGMWSRLSSLSPPQQPQVPGAGRSPAARTPHPAGVRGHPRSAAPGNRGWGGGSRTPSAPNPRCVCLPGTSSSGRLVSAGPPSLSAGTLLMVRPARLLVPPAAAASGRAALGAGPGGRGGAGAGRRGRGGTGRGRGGAAVTDRAGPRGDGGAQGYGRRAMGTRDAGPGTWDTVPGTQSWGHRTRSWEYRTILETEDSLGHKDTRLGTRGARMGRGTQSQGHGTRAGV